MQPRLFARARFARIIPVVQPGARILCLSWDETTPPRLAKFFCARGLSETRIIVLEAMGGPRERIRETLAADFDLRDIDPLNVAAVEIPVSERACFLPRSSGLADSWFLTDGQLTKREVRAIALSALAPRRGELLWDVGAGSGSIAVEWLLADPANRAIAIESREDRANRIKRNAETLGVPQIEIVHGKAPDAFAKLPQPQAIFVGGGASEARLLDAAYAALPVGGRLVANAVTLESESEFFRRFKQLGGELTRIEIAHANALGPFQAWCPARPITQWSITKQ